jgi:hypothetical protein
MITLPWIRKAPAATTARWPLDMPLVAMSKHAADQWRLRDALSGLVILGNNGSGKTTSSGRIVAQSFLRANLGGLILCAKTDEATRFVKYAKAMGRERDLRVFGVDEPYRFNFISYEAERTNVQVESLVHMLVTIATGRRTEAKGDEATFWKPQKLKFLRNCITLLLMAGESVDLVSIYKILSSAPQDLDQVDKRSWQDKSYLYHLLIKADQKSPHHPELPMVKTYWLTEWAKLNPKTRGTVEADLTGLLDPLTRGALGELFSGQSNLTPDDVLGGRLVVVNIPEREHYEAARYCALIWMQMLERTVDRREFRAGEDRPIFIWIDEAQLYAHETDPFFQATCRSKGCAVVRICQNYPLLRVAYGSKDVVDSLLENHVSKILHRNDGETNEWAARLIGKHIDVRHSISRNGTSGSDQQISASEHEVDSCPTSEFINLRSGGPPDWLAEAVLFQSGRQWLGSLRWARRTFTQEI